MSLSVCVQGLVAEGKIKPGQALEADQLYTRHFNALKGQMNMMAAASVASERAIAALRAQAARRKMLAALTIQTRQRLEADLQRYGGGSGGGGGGAGGGGPIDPRAGPALLGGDGRAPYSNVEGRMRAIRGRAHAMIDGILAKHSTNLLGKIRKPAELVDLVRELFGQDSGNLAARELADAWRQAAEMLRQRFNAAGGDIGRIEDWGLPQSHDPRAVRAAGYDAWRAEILPRLDRAKMIDTHTGLPFADDELEAALREVFDTIRSDGWSGREAGNQAAGILANRRGDGRFLHFKSADDWLAYSEKFGAGSAFDAMMGHIDGMARDIAQLEILGPNPNASIAWLKDTLTKSAAADTAPNSKATDRAHAATKKIDRLFAEVTGATHRPENRKLALAFSALRSWQTAAKLGGATLSAVTDLAFQASTRRFNGLAGRTLLKDYVKLLRPGALEDQKLAVRRGLIAEEWAHRTAAQGRYLGEELTGEVSRRLAEGVLRASGLSRWTQAGRWAFGMEFLATLTERRGKGFAELEEPLQAALQRYGMGPAEWDAIRAAPTIEDGGADWIDPPSLPNRALGDRLLEMIARETDHAVPMQDLVTKAWMNAKAPRGDLLGESIRSALLFKGFGLSVVIMQSRRTMEQAGANRLRYAAGLTIGTTLMGAAALWLKDVAAGRDPRAAADIPFVDDETGELDLTNPGFWGAALLQGGGFGIFGDFLKSSTNRAGGGIPGTLAGPLFGDAQKLANVVTAKNTEGAAFKFVRDQLPGGTLWYARLAFDRQIADQIQEAVDPEYAKSWRRMRQWAEDQGTNFYWEPGEVTPERAPDIGNIASGASLDTSSADGGFTP